MAGLDVRQLEAPKPFEVVGGWPPPRQPASGDDDALLLEAIRFHEFSTTPVFKPSSFVRFEGTSALANVLPGLRRDLHDEAAEFLSVLAGPLVGKIIRPGGNVRGELTDGQLRQVRGETLSARRAGQLADGVPEADGGRVAVRTLLSPAWRHPNRVDQLRNPKNQVRFRRLEDLDSALFDLRAMIKRSAVEAAIGASFGHAIIDRWGGTKVIRRPGRQDSSAPGGGYVALGETEVGLTEKLYQEFATTAFTSAHGTARAPENKTPSPFAIDGPGGPFRLHLEVRKQVDFIIHETLFLATKLPPPPREAHGSKAVPTSEPRAAATLSKPFSVWFANLDTLETCFMAALRSSETAKLAIEVGLPWGIALTAVLRAYLVELIGRTMMVAVPVEYAHKALDGNLAVALWEALAGQNAPHVSHPGYLVPVKQGERPPAEHPLLHALQTWNSAGQDPAAFVRAWPTVPWHTRAAQVLRRMAAARSFIPAKPEEKKGQPTPDLSGKLEDQIQTWPAYPVASLPGVRRSDEGTDLRVGGSLSAQGHLYVAAWILSKAVNFGVPLWNPKDRDEEIPAPPVPPPKPLASALQLGDGSYLWGGRFPPHTTHMDGATFDLRFGPECLRWATTDLPSGAVSKALRAELNGRNITWLEIIGTSCDRKKQLSIQPRRYVLLTLMGDLIRELLKDARTKLSRSGAGEVKGYDDIEKQLKGTPHFCSTRGAQQILAGHVAILLSGPIQLIFASPITHLRAMKAIHASLRATPLRRAATDLLDTAAFVFKPQDHHNHWHVHYNPPHDKSQNPKKTPVDRFIAHLQLWSALGVDLQPFLEYLNSLKLIQAGGPQLAAASQELVRLQDELRAYRPDADGRKLLEEVFRHLSTDAEESLVVPAATSTLSPELEDVVRDSNERLRRALAANLSAMEHFEELVKPPPEPDESDEVE
jgi:hypothetical protein